MNDLLPEELVNRIVESASLNDAAIEVRDSQLRQAAYEAWGLIFPEDREPGSPRLSKETRRERWQAVLEQLAKYPEKEKILRVIESSASGERFYWLNG